MSDLPDDAALATRRAMRKAKISKRPARLVDGNVFSVPSATHPGQTHEVRLLNNTAAIGEPMLFSCTCKAGEFRSAWPVPCSHAATAALMLSEYNLVGFDSFGLLVRAR